MFNYGGVNFSYGRGVEGLREAWGPDNSRVTVTLYCDWDSRIDARDALLGTSAMAAGPPAYISRTVPHSLDWAPRLYARQITSVVPSAPDEELDADRRPRGQQAKLVVDYEPLPYPVLSDAALTAIAGFPDESYILRWVRKEKTDGMRFFSSRPGDWEWDEMVPVKPVITAMSIPLPRSDITYHWYQVPLEARTPFAIWEEAQGKTNDNIFDGYAAQTLTFMGAKPQFFTFPNGTYGVNVAMTFQYYPLGANKFPNPNANGAFQTIRRKDTVATRPYSTYDFGKLFRPA